MKVTQIYLASPFFNETELKAVAEAEKILRDRGYTVYSPREHEYRGAEAGTTEWADAIFYEDVGAINDSSHVVVLYHGNYSDSGTAWECGYAFAQSKALVAVILGGDANLMVHRCVSACISMDDLRTYNFERMPENEYTGPML